MKKFLLALLLATAVSFANAKTGHTSTTHSTAKLSLELPIAPVGGAHEEVAPVSSVHK